METVKGLFSYWVVIGIILIGLYIVIANANLIKKVVGLNIFQTGVFILFITMGKVENGSAPILVEGVTRYSNPLPHVLILTAIVVGVATTAVALALTVRIHDEYRSLEEDEIAKQDQEAGE